MKKIFKLLFLTVLLVSMVGCSTMNDEIVSLRKSNKELIDQIQKVDLMLSGDFSVTIRKLIPDYEESDKVNSLAIASFYQSPVFILPVGKKIASQLKEGEAYTFKIIEPSFFEGYPFPDYKNKIFTYEKYLQSNTVKFELVGEAKESELGLNSNRIVAIEKSIEDYQKEEH